MIRILVDSSSDYSLEEIRAKKIDFVPLHVNFGDTNYADVIDLERNRFYELLTGSADFPTTSQPAPQAFLDVFLDAKEKGDEVICILLSSALSGTCQSAVIARSMANYDKIHIFDSLSATHMIRIMAESALALRDQGADAVSIIRHLQDLAPRVKVCAALDTLLYLSKGGRLSKTTAVIGEAANIKPLIALTPDGNVSVIGKTLGKNKAISFILKHLETVSLDPAYPLCSAYTYGTENCEKLEEKLASAGYSISERCQVGSTIGTHVGPGVFGVFYVEKIDYLCF